VSILESGKVISGPEINIVLNDWYHCLEILELRTDSFTKSKDGRKLNIIP
jgi:hypothetical protein